MILQSPKWKQPRVWYSRPMDGRPESYSEWEALEALPIPTIKDESQQGRTYDIGVIHTLAVPVPAEEEMKVNEETYQVGTHYVFASVKVSTKEGSRWYRLPNDLTEWAAVLAVTAKQTMKFPCKIEFGKLRGRYYADFVV